MILFAASFKIPSKNDRPLFISISSNRQPGPMIPSLSPSNFLESRFPFLRATYTRAYTDTLVHTRVVTVTVSASEEEAHYAQSISAPRHLSRSRNRDENARGPRVTHTRPSSPLVIFDTVSPLVASVIHRHAKTRGWILWRWNRIWSGGLKEEILF